MSVALSASGLPVLEKYELVEEIGHGGMATVYRARDRRLGRDVAVKLIHKHLRENAEVATRFVAEARASAKLRHRNIVDVYDVSGEDEGERYLVVELLRGTTLRKVLQQYREMPAEVGAAIVLELCDALEHAHESGIIHRDVKPENVLVELPADRARAVRDECEGQAKRARPSGRGSLPSGPRSDPGEVDDAACVKPAEGEVVIKLTDFGIAKILDAQGVTSTGQVLGSPAHMAPEQIEGGEVDARTDVFGLGVLMYEALVGHLPFEGKNPAQVLRRVLDGSFSAADRERPTVGGRWAAIVAGALAHDIADRTESPSALGAQIRAELAALGVADPHAEVNAFFADPEGYAARHPARIAPCLCARGEEARRRRKIPAAATDFNRALALMPTDLAILKRVTSLTTSSGRRLLAKRVLAVACSSVALGALAFGVARWRRDDPPPAVDAAPGPEASDVARPDAAPPDPSAVVADPTAPPDEPEAPEHKRIRLVLPPSVAPIPPKPAQPLRNVQFSIIPKGARLSLDGQDVPSWFTRKFLLAPGKHVADVKMTDSSCCKPQRKEFVVDPVPADKPTDVQFEIIRLELLPSKVSLTGAPPNGQCYCTRIGLSLSPGAAQAITLPEALWTGPCRFTSPDLAAPREDTVSLRAGEPNSIQWPSL